MSEKSNINGVEVGELLEFKNICAQHPEKADRHPALVAYWEGGSRSRIEFKGMTVHLGGHDVSTRCRCSSPPSSPAMWT